MRLPQHNTLTLEEDNEHWVADGSEPPAIDDDALFALLPEFARRGDSQIRAAYLAVLRKALNYCWAQWGQVLAEQRTPRDAAGVWLDIWGEVLKRTRVIGEEDPQYRERLLTPLDMVTPAAIKRAVLRVAEKVTLFDPLIIEPGDVGLYLTDEADTMGWTDFWQPVDVRLWGIQHGIAYPGVGAYYESGMAEAMFWVILYEDPQVEGVYLSEQIVSEVEQRRAAGATWTLFVDPAAVRGI